MVVSRWGWRSFYSLNLASQQLGSVKVMVFACLPTNYCQMMHLSFTWHAVHPRLPFSGTARWWERVDGWRPAIECRSMAQLKSTRDFPRQNWFHNHDLTFLPFPPIELFCLPLWWQPIFYFPLVDDSFSFDLQINIQVIYRHKTVGILLRDCFTSLRLNSGKCIARRINTHEFLFKSLLRFCTL